MMLYVRVDRPCGLGFGVLHETSEHQRQAIQLIVGRPLGGEPQCEQPIDFIVKPQFPVFTFEAGTRVGVRTKRMGGGSVKSKFDREPN